MTNFKSNPLYVFAEEKNIVEEISTEKTGKILTKCIY